ncbi:MAG: oligosaccharide flippase family protein [Flavobacteriales bacterium]|jgi:O-antigen/teichoic acid export membrane protein|nr:oligosaccharide flippase family protein [Flavobacteriales bacterium]HOZ40762.1 oligosaccharide flippase family protein [Flavobacteriales bacterium]
MGILARQTLLNTVLTYAGIVLGFVNVVLLYPKVLQADQFGLTRLLVSITVVAAQLSQLGVENTVLRFFPYFKDDQRKHRGLLSMLVLFGTAASLLCMLALAALHPWLSDVFNDRNSLYAQYGLLVLPLVLGEVFFILLRSFSRSLRRTVQPTFIREFMLRAMQTILILVQAWAMMPFHVFMLLYTALFLIGTLALVWDLYRSGNFALGWSERWLPTRLRKSMVTYSTFTFSATLAGIILGNMDQLMIGALLGDGLRQVAYYSVAFYFGSVIAAPGRALSQGALPLIAEAWKRDDHVYIADLYRRSSLVQFLVSGFLFLVMWSSVGDLFELLPSEYAPAAEVAIIIGSAYLMTSSIGLSVGIISMSRSYRLDAISSMAMLLVNLVADYFLIRVYGIIGAAYATLLALLVVNGYRTWFLYRRYGLWPFELRTVGILGLIVTLGIMVPWIPLTGLAMYDLFLRFLLLTVLFWPVAFLFGTMPELKGVMSQFSKRLK